jgi:hypothetical protein
MTVYTYIRRTPDLAVEDKLNFGKFQLRVFRVRKQSTSKENLLDAMFLHATPRTLTSMLNEQPSSPSKVFFAA